MTTLITALQQKKYDSLIDPVLFNKFKDEKTSTIYLAGINFTGTPSERVTLSIFIKQLLGFFLPNHISTLPEHEAKEILSNSTLLLLWQTVCTLYEEEEFFAKNSASFDIIKRLNLENASEEDKRKTLEDIRNIIYLNYFSAILETEEETPMIEALRKAFEMDEKEAKRNEDHTYQFFVIALKNFILQKEAGTPFIKLFEKIREETIHSLSTEEKKDTPSTL